MALQAVLVLKELKEMDEEIQKRKRRQFWVNPFLSTRAAFDIESHLLKDLCWGGGENYFKNFTRLNIHEFEELLAKVCVKPFRI